MARRTDRAAEILEQILSVDSPSGREWEFVVLLCSLLDELGVGYRIERGYGIANVVVNPDANVFFDAHIDVVRPWFPPRREGSIVYGRGASDDKGSIASILLAMEDVSFEHVGFVFTADEEESGRGVKLFVENHRPRMVFVMEPTEGCVYDGQAGDLDFEAVFVGKEAHAAHIDYMDNPILRAVDVINKIRSSEFLEYKEGMRIKPGMNVLRLIGDGQGYRNPSRAELSVSIRLDPSQDAQSVASHVDNILSQYAAEYRFDGPTQGFVVPKTSEIYALAREAARRSGIPFGGTIHGWTHMHTYHRAGIESILIGPGSRDRTHTMEEYVKLENVIRVADFIKEVEYILAQSPK